MIDTNIRSVKVDKDVYHSRTKTRGAKDLCQHCGHNGNCTKQQKNAQEELYECREYQFPIAFRDARGLAGEFNTMRLGKAWFGRVKEGDVVALVDKEGTRVGQAQVQRVFLLPKDEALHHHAEQNHLYREKTWRDKMLSVTAKMEKILRSSYGNLVYNNNDRVTVIYLEEKGR